MCLTAPCFRAILSEEASTALENVNHFNPKSPTKQSIQISQDEKPKQKPQWPITTTREKHGDNEVFLARANNPFGYSTKWKYT